MPWLVTPERLRPGARGSTRWLWFTYDERWQHLRSGVEETRQEAVAQVKRGFRPNGGPLSGAQRAAHGPVVVPERP